MLRSCVVSYLGVILQMLLMPKNCSASGVRAWHRHVVRYPGQMVAIEMFGKAVAIAGVLSPHSESQLCVAFAEDALSPPPTSPIHTSASWITHCLSWYHHAIITTGIAWLIFTKSQTADSLLVIRALGVQTSTSSPLTFGPVARGPSPRRDT